MTDQTALKKLLSIAARDISGAFAARLCCLGDELNLFKALAGHGLSTSQELSQNTGLNERYLREWMYGVALACYINFDKISRKGSLSDEQQLVLGAEGG